MTPREGRKEQRDPRVDPRAGDAFRFRGEVLTVLSVDMRGIRYEQGRFSAICSFDFWPQKMKRATIVKTAEQQRETER